MLHWIRCNVLFIMGNSNLSNLVFLSQKKEKLEDRTLLCSLMYFIPLPHPLPFKIYKQIMKQYSSVFSVIHWPFITIVCFKLNLFPFIESLNLFMVASKPVIFKVWSANLWGSLRPFQDVLKYILIIMLRHHFSLYWHLHWFCRNNNE